MAMIKFLIMIGMIVMSVACQSIKKPSEPSDNHTITQENNAQNTHSKQSTKTDVNDILKETTISFRQETGRYPLFVSTDYQTINADIQRMIDELLVFDKQFTGDSVEGVSNLNYEILIFDDNDLAFLIDFNVQDYTARYFLKYYHIDLKNKRKIDFLEYLNKQSVDIDKLNNAFKNFIKQKHIECLSSEAGLCDVRLGYLIGLLSFNNLDLDIDVVNLHDILDKDHVVIAMNSTKFTSSFKINIHTYEIDLI